MACRAVMLASRCRSSSISARCICKMKSSCIHKIRVWNTVKYIHLILKIIIPYHIYKQTTNSVAFRPRANYTDWSTATCWRNLVSTFVDRGVSRGQRCGSPTVVNLFSRPVPLLFFQVAPHLSSQGLSGPHSRPTATQKIW
jgi:hypothetical protein